ncbi:DUF2256 domain-containing protein [Brevundimonas sp. BH3]|uniref:DUF2256 domain-containing protein n=1 Tax=Brevundimonas sp. BH3 TaxID=3133089 RepID=UPI00324A8D09
MQGVHKRDLPFKTCPVCMRPFSWRKKWQKDWPNVVYCSARCASRKSAVKEPALPL